MSNYSVVIFDLDGTLLDTLEDLRDSVNHVLDLLGYRNRSLEEIRSFVGNGIGMLMKRSLPEPLDAEAFDAALESFRDFYTANCENKTCAYPGVTELLSKLCKQGIRTAIVSNKNDAAVRRLVRKFFPALTDIAVGEREGIRRKPAPDSVNEVIAQLGVSLNEVVYVGDSEIDKETADAAGIDCVLVDWGFRDRKQLEECHPIAVIHKAEELLTLL